MALSVMRTFCNNGVKLKVTISPLNHLRFKTGSLKTNEIPKKIKKNPSFSRRITKQLFERYLLTTNIVGSGLLMVVGDVMAQEIEYRRGLSSTRCDFGRIARMFIVGAAQGPLHHFFYKWMDTIMPVVTMSSVFKKIVLDQIVMSPACILIFFYSAGLLERKNIDQCNEELRSKFLTVYTVDWLVWPFAQFINFYWLHPKYRVTYVNVVTAVYNIFLSYIKHDEKQQHQENLGEVQQMGNVK